MELGEGSLTITKVVKERMIGVKSHRQIFHIIGIQKEGIGYKGSQELIFNTS